VLPAGRHRLSARLALLVLASALFLSGLTSSALAALAPPIWSIQSVAAPTIMKTSDSVSAVQQIKVAATGGTFTLTFQGQTTVPIAHDAPAKESDGAGSVEAALNALVGIGGSVTVTGGPGDELGEHPYVVTFEGKLRGAPEASIEADSVSLTGGSHSATVTTITQGSTNDEYAVQVQNIGGSDSSGMITINDQLPSGVTTTASPVPQINGFLTPAFICTSGAALSEVTCTGEPAIASGPAVSYNNDLVNSGEGLIEILIPVTVSAGFSGNGTNTATVSGGGAETSASVSASNPLNSSTPPAFGLSYFNAQVSDEIGIPATQAGGHPYAVTVNFGVNSETEPGEVGAAPGDNVAINSVAEDDPRELAVDLPPGLVGNPVATPRCPLGRVADPGLNRTGCPRDTQVGIVYLKYFGSRGPGLSGPFALFNVVPEPGRTAEFALNPIGNSLVVLYGEVVRTDLGNVVRVIVPTPRASLHSVSATFFGNPAGVFSQPGAHTEGRPFEDTEERPFLINPTNCQAGEAQRALTMHADSWQHPGVLSAGGFPEFDDPNWLARSVTLPPVGGCSQLHFNPSFSFQPESTRAASPSAFTADLEVPQASGSEDPAVPPLKKAVVVLPSGVDVNPAAAQGLGACSEAQIELEGNEAPTCPDSARIGSVEVKTPLLEEKLTGSIYLARQDENPFHSLLALYLVIEDHERGVLIKLPGEVRPDPQSGQLTATFDQNPQLPFSSLKLDFDGGPRAPLATPAICATYTTHGELIPWSAPESGPAAQTTDSFQVSSGPGGGPCATSEAARPFGPGFEAGTTATQAGAYSPLVIRLTRKDGEQELSRLDFTLPPGLTGKLAGIPYCPDAGIAAAEAKSGSAEQQSPSCPAASQLGSVRTGTGVGDAPISVPGKVYLAGPYHGAPLSAVVITPAVAGPFDLGDVVVRTALHIDPETAQIRATSDPIPTIVKGIPLQLRSLAIEIDRQDFSLNPTSCEPMALTASIAGSSGATASPSNRFQVGGCGKLNFKPKLQLSLKGSIGRAGHPALKAVVTYPQGGAYANISRAQVNLPHSEFLDQGSLNRTCTRPVLLEGRCPAKSIYGKAKAWTPLLDKPLEGPVYLVGGYGYKLPALVAELNGQIRVVLKGKIDSGPNKGIRNTFEAVPDAPVSRFVLEMKGGKKYGLLENSENICQKPQRAIAHFTAQNGLVDQTKPLIANQCAKAKHDVS
jgi:hypothetical protein